MHLPTQGTYPAMSTRAWICPANGRAAEPDQPVVPVERVGKSLPAAVQVDRDAVGLKPGAQLPHWAARRVLDHQPPH